MTPRDAIDRVHGCEMCMIDQADRCDFEVSEYPRARKEHRCEECGRMIQPGERYRRTVQKFDGDVSAWKMCTHCEAAASYLIEHCNGYLVGGVREDLEEHWAERAPDRMFLGRAIVGLRKQWLRRDGSLMRRLPDLGTTKGVGKIEQLPNNVASTQNANRSGGSNT